MGTHFKHGFTIIETMLVLAVTGVLVAGLLVGLGASISNQRYLDSVATFKSFVQEQYSKINNVTNDRNANWACDASANPVEVNGGGVALGQSDCVLLGRYVGIVDDRLTTATVVGYPRVATPSASTINSVINDYTLGISRSSVEQSALEWGARIAWPASGVGAASPTSPRSLSLLLIRSPENGTTYTFTSDTVNEIDSVTGATLTSMMVPNIAATNPGQGARVICVEPGGVNVPEKLAIYIGAGASTANAVEVRSAALFEAAREDTRC